jgi:hypothetical protein
MQRMSLPTAGPSAPDLPIAQSAPRTGPASGPCARSAHSCAAPVPAAPSRPFPAPASGSALGPALRGPSPGHVDLALEGEVAGQGEGRRHRCVTDVGGGPDSRYVLRCEQARTHREHVVNVAMTAMRWHHCEVSDDRVVTVVRGDHESDWFSVRQRRDPPPLVRAGVALEFVAVLLLCGLTGGSCGSGHRDCARPECRPARAS